MIVETVIDRLLLKCGRLLQPSVLPRLDLHQSACVAKAIGLKLPPMRRDARETNMRAHQIMSKDVITVGPDASIVEAARLMLEHRISGLPVLDKDGRLIGIISE